MAEHRRRRHRSSRVRLASYSFGRPYVNHPGEPFFYFKAQQWRGLFDLSSFLDGYPPGYIALNLVIQYVLEAVGIKGLSATIGVLR